MTGGGQPEILGFGSAGLGKGGIHFSEHDAPTSQPGKSGTKKVDERYHFMSFSNFLIILFRIFRESDY